MDESTLVEQINAGKRPEPSHYDRRRHEEMRLKQNGLYGIPKVSFNSDLVFPGTCLGCCFKGEVHSCGK